MDCIPDTKRIQPKTRDAAWQIAALFNPDDWVEIRAIDVRNKVLPVTQYWVKAADFASAKSWTDSQFKIGRDIYFGVNPRSRHGGARAEHVNLVRFFWADFDNMDETQAREAIDAARLPTPSILIRSGGGIHVYWKLDETLNIESDADRAKVSAIVGGIAQATGGDRAVKDVSRVFRLVGFDNRKLETPREVRVLHPRDGEEQIAEYDILEFEHLATAKPPAPAPATNGNGQHVAVASLDRVKRYLEKVPPAVEGDGGEPATFRLGAKLTHDFGLSVDDALEAMRDWNSRCSPPWPEHELRAKLENAKTYGKATIGAASAPTAIEIEVTRPTAAGSATITAIRGSEILYRNRANIDREKERAEVVAAIAAATGMPPTDIERQLLTFLANGTNDTNGTNGGNEASRLVALVRGSDCELFHDSNGDGFATVRIKEHFETHRLNSRAFKRWMASIYFEKLQTAPSAETIGGALLALDGFAAHEGDEFPVFLRIAEINGEIVIDIGDDEWRAIVITRRGWRVVSSEVVPVKFRRAAGMMPLPSPIEGGSIGELRELINIGDEAQWILLKAWLLGALRPTGPYPILAINGVQGTAKSTLSRMARALVDPSSVPLRRPPGSERDLMIAASNGWVVAFDNLSGVPNSLSDPLSTISTGGGFAARTLYSDSEETLFTAMRPMVLNGIDDIATKSDLLDRCLNLRLPALEGDYRDEVGLWAAFNAAAPRIFGALLDAVSAALANLVSATVPHGARLADFAKWIVAGAPALGMTADEFVAAYTQNRAEANETALESSPVGAAVVAMMTDRETWIGTATDLMAALADERITDEKTRAARNWPRAPRGMRNALQRVAPNLRAARIGVEFTGPEWAGPGVGNRRLISISHLSVEPAPNAPNVSCASCAPCADTEKPASGDRNGDSAAHDTAHGTNRLDLYRAHNNGDSGSRTPILNPAHDAHDAHDRSGASPELPNNPELESEVVKLWNSPPKPGESPLRRAARLTAAEAELRQNMTERQETEVE